MKSLFAISFCSLLSIGMMFGQNSTSTSKSTTTTTTTSTSTSTSGGQQNGMDMQKWMKDMTPADMQKMMAASAGEWTATSTMWMPGQPAQTMQSKVHNDMILGGRYLTSKYEGTMMGMPFEGMATMAYDNTTQKFYSTWIDNMSTGMSQMSGTYDPKTKMISMTGISQDPTTSTKDVNVRETVTFTDDTHMTMDMYGAGPDGKEMKYMEIVLTKM